MHTGDERIDAGVGGAPRCTRAGAGAWAAGALLMAASAVAGAPAAAGAVVTDTSPSPGVTAPSPSASPVPFERSFAGTYTFTAKITSVEANWTDATSDESVAGVDRKSKRTWTVVPDCPTGPCDVTVTSTSGNTFPLTYKDGKWRASGSYSGDCVDTQTGEVVKAGGFKVKYSYSLKPAGGPTDPYQELTGTAVYKGGGCDDGPGTIKESRKLVRVGAAPDAAAAAAAQAALEAAASASAAAAAASASASAAALAEAESASSGAPVGLIAGSAVGLLLLAGLGTALLKARPRSKKKADEARPDLPSTRAVHDPGRQLVIPDGPSLAVGVRAVPDPEPRITVTTGSDPDTADNPDTSDNHDGGL